VPTWLSGTAFGLAYDRWTLGLALAMTGLWLVSLFVLVSRGRGWRAVPLSLLGWSWIAFGLAFVARFWVLSIDAVTYGDLSERLLVMPPSVVDLALALSTLYWASVLVAYRLVGAPRINPLASVGRIVGAGAFSAYDALTVISIVALIVGADVEHTPAALVRPLSLIGSLWVVGAAAAWFLSFDRGSARRFAVRRWVYLAPGLLSFVVEPFRERLLLMLLIPLLAALFAGRRPRLAVLIVVFAVFAIASTITVSWYRQVAWDDGGPGGSEHLDVDLWLKEPYYAPWTAVLRRFHSFDSLVFYTYLVPDVVPFEAERNPIADVLLEGFVPRAIYPDKPESRRAMLFSVTLWSYGDEGRSEANIAPSMAGDLYGVGGWMWVLLGGACWGGLLGVLDRWRERLPAGGQTVVVTALCLLAAGGIERDFPRAAATLIQTVIVLIGAAIVLRRTLGVGRARLTGVRPPPSGEWSREPAPAP
jgi:hypothetical protein